VNDKSSHHLKVAGVFCGIAVIFLAFSLSLLTKDPVVYPDEVAFANVAYSLISEESFSAVPFSSRLPAIEEAELIYHGPVYYWFLALALRLFGFGIATVRMTSVFLGVATLLVGFFLAKKSLQSAWFGLLAVFLLAIDHNFSRGARLGRPEILVTFFNYLTLLFYLKSLKNPRRKEYLLVGLFGSLGFFTHILLGLIAPLVILSHLLVSRGRSFLRDKNFFYLILIPALCSLLWLFYLHFTTSAWDRLAPSASRRLRPDFYSLRSIFGGRLYGKVIFLIHSLSLVLLLFKFEKNSLRVLLLLNFLVTFVVVALGGNGWYLGLLTFPACLALLRISREWRDERKVVHGYVWWVPVGILIIFSLLIWFKALDFFAGYSYESHARGIADRLPRGSRVLLRQMTPEPYFFLVQHRPDLKLAYEQFYDYDQSNFKAALSEAEYVVTRAADYGVLSFWLELEAAEDPQREAKYAALMKEYSTRTRPALVNYLRENRPRGVSLIKGTKHYPAIAIFRLDTGGE